MRGKRFKGPNGRETPEWPGQICSRCRRPGAEHSGAWECPSEELAYPPTLDQRTTQLIVNDDPMPRAGRASYADRIYAIDPLKWQNAVNNAERMTVAEAARRSVKSVGELKLEPGQIFTVPPIFALAEDELRALEAMFENPEIGIGQGEVRALVASLEPAKQRDFWLNRFALLERARDARRTERQLREQQQAARVAAVAQAEAEIAYRRMIGDEANKLAAKGPMPDAEMFAALDRAAQSFWSGQRGQQAAWPTQKKPEIEEPKVAEGPRRYFDED